MTLAQLSAALLHVFEGCRLTAYQDSGGVWTIGFGHTKGVTAGQTITMDQATTFLEEDAAPLLLLVQNKPLAAGAAYASFGYNCGYHTLELVLAGKAELSNFVHDRHGNVLPGLVARRGLEAALIAVGA